MSQLSVAKRMIALRHRLGLTQIEMGRRLSASAMSVSRWERGTPLSPEVLIQLGILGSKTECWYFWGMAGFTRQGLLRALPIGCAESSPNHAMQIVVAGAKSIPRGKKKQNR
jgi:transcriptional regulator with XRE-family HTH domain